MFAESFLFLNSYSDCLIGLVLFLFVSFPFSATLTNMDSNVTRLLIRKSTKISHPAIIACWRNAAWNGRPTWRNHIFYRTINPPNWSDMYARAFQVMFSASHSMPCVCCVCGVFMQARRHTFQPGMCGVRAHVARHLCTLSFLWRAILFNIYYFRKRVLSACFICIGNTGMCET